MSILRNEAKRPVLEQERHPTGPKRRGPIAWKASSRRYTSFMPDNAAWQSLWSERLWGFGWRRGSSEGPAMPARAPRAGAGTPITAIIDRLCLGGGAAHPMGRAMGRGRLTGQWRTEAERRRGRRRASMTVVRQS